MIARAQATDLAAILHLLEEVGLPTEGVAEHLNSFFVARDAAQAGKLIGCIGQERYSDVTLLRSLAVTPNLQRSGLGKALTARLLDEALAESARDVVLLTTTAADFFARQFGFAEAGRSEFDSTFADSPEWHLPRCSSAVCMRLRLNA